MPFPIEGFPDAYIRSMSATEKATDWDAWYRDKNGEVLKKRYQKRFAKLIQLCVVKGETTKTIFQEDEIDDLMLIDDVEFERMADACLEFNSYLGEPEKN